MWCCCRCRFLPLTTKQAHHLPVLLSQTQTLATVALVLVMTEHCNGDVNDDAPRWLRRQLWCLIMLRRCGGNVGINWYYFHIPLNIISKARAVAIGAAPMRCKSTAANQNQTYALWGVGLLLSCLCDMATNILNQNLRPQKRDRWYQTPIILSKFVYHFLLLRGRCFFARLHGRSTKN